MSQIPLSRLLAEPVDGASVAVFRMLFGGIIAWEAYRYLHRGWIQEYWIEPTVQFSYYGFDWVHRLPGDLIYLHWIAIAVVALFIAAGIGYRISAFALWILFTYQFLLESTRFLNHFYAACLLAFLLAIVPADRTWSLSRRARTTVLGGTVPMWSLAMLRFQVGVVYVFGGLGKLSSDWLAGTPVDIWMAQRANAPLVSLILDLNLQKWIFSYGGLTVDLCMVPCLLWKRTRLWAFGGAVVFNLLNSQLFNIGIFPWMMVAATTLFLDPSWPRHALALLEGTNHSRPKRENLGQRRINPLGMTTMALFVAFQLGLPIRKIAYPGNSLWTEEGGTFAWHMMLRDKRGLLRILVETQSGREEVSLESYLRPFQTQRVSTDPDLILQLSHFVARQYRQRGVADVRVFASAQVSLNGRPPSPIVDSTVDLASVKRSLLPAAWIIREYPPRNSMTARYTPPSQQF